MHGDHEPCEWSAELLFGTIPSRWAQHTGPNWSSAFRFMESLLSLLRMHWDHEPAASHGTARQLLGLRENRTTDWDVRLRAASSAAFPGMHRMGKHQGTGKSELQLETRPSGQAVQNLAA